MNRTALDLSFCFKLYYDLYFKACFEYLKYACHFALSCYVFDDGGWSFDRQSAKCCYSGPTIYPETIIRRIQKIYSSMFFVFF